MAGRGPQTFKKRQKEQQRKEKQQEKVAKRLQRRQDKIDGVENPDDSNPEELLLGPQGEGQDQIDEDQTPQVQRPEL